MNDPLRAAYLSLALLPAVAGATEPIASIFGPGPSDPALFETVITLEQPDHSPLAVVQGSSLQVNIVKGAEFAVLVLLGESVEVNVIDGFVNDIVDFSVGSEHNFLGGTGVGDLRLEFATYISFAGGDLNDANVRVGPGRTVDIIGREFYLDGEAINGLAPFEPTLLPDREVTLSGVLSDGSPFAFDLLTSGTGDLFPIDTNLRLILTPEPTTLALLLPATAAALLRRRPGRAHLWRTRQWERR